ncbi:MAG: polysaccharide lyase family 1 protein [Hamadaea sp.]|nr:polysaccharide lyase family 1 protein [Hamadaea sp.]NUR49213.1 polysaccharide lyase family 1 protein [Hamadaea sp.]NUT07001.1 polysaccharide lyase family 1 protein [Hamadaea sp.]
MRTLRSTAVVAAVALLATGAAAPAAASGGSRDGLTPWAIALGRATLPTGDGWAAEGTGTTGGSAADADHVFVVDDRAELVAALGGDNATNRTNATPKLIFVRGAVNGFERADGTRLTCADLADPGYSLSDYLTAYAPETWGRTKPTGALEEARVRSVANQTAQTQINVGPNTTIVGLRGARFDELTLMIDTADNVIVRNLTFADSHDCFPAWSPTDGATGNWNSQFDNVSVRRSQHVWLDHNSFSDAGNPDSTQPIYFGRPYQVHDGAMDITHTSNLVTVSYSAVTGHDKVMLIGSTDNPSGGDPGRLKVTLHHNYFEGTYQRLPRVRFGQVDLYNNAYRLGGDEFQYAWGVGFQSALYAENNYVSLADGVDPAEVVHDWGGTALTERGTWLRVGDAAPKPVSLLDAYNSAHDPDLGSDAGWTPSLRSGPVLPAPAVAWLVPLFAGARL